MNYPQGLIDMLTKYPSIAKAYVKDDEWMFCPTDGFTEVSREEILKEGAEETTTNNKPKKGK